MFFYKAVWVEFSFSAKSSLKSALFSADVGVVFGYWGTAFVRFARVL